MLDQLDDSTFDPLTREERKKLRVAHLETTGGKPMLASRPTSDQLAALKARMANGDAPYCDFAVFGAFGKRLLKIKKFEAQVFVDGALKTRHLRGPSDFDAWSGCWKVFRAAMVMLGAASPQSLDDYHDGIKQLCQLFPRHWGVIFCADEILRGEMWDSIADDLEDEGKLPANLPWDHIMSITTFGKAVGDHQHFWNTYVVWPCQAPGNAKVVVKEMEGSVHVPGDDAPYGTGRIQTKLTRPHSRSPDKEGCFWAVFRGCGRGSFRPKDGARKAFWEASCVGGSPGSEGSPPKGSSDLQCVEWWWLQSCWSLPEWREARVLQVWWRTPCA